MSDTDTQMAERVANAINALLIEVSEVAEDAYGYDHIYETTFHGHVYEKLSEALKSYRASTGSE